METQTVHWSRRAAIGFLVAVAAFVAMAASWRLGSPGAASADTAADGDSCALFDHEHTGWTAVLGGYVRGGFVDYAGLRKRGAADFRAYLWSVGSVCRGHYDMWTRAQKLAFWINAYNAYTVKLILDHYPLDSVRSIGLLPGAAFRDGFISLPKLGRPRLSLNDIEHEILRAELREPRIHFAIVCASQSCPALRSEAYRAPALEEQLEDATRTFVRDGSKNRFDPASRTLRLSAIFDWFHEDFERAAGTVPAFVARYADATTASALRAGAVRVEFLDYDWSLNGR